MRRRGGRPKSSTTIAWPARGSGVDDSVVTLRLSVRNVLADFVHVRVDVARLAREERADRSVKVRVAKPMARPGRLRDEAACNLVLALRPGLEPFQAFADAVVDTLVIARLEVQAVEVGAAAPVAAIERRVAAEADRCRDRRAVATREHDEQVVG